MMEQLLLTLIPAVYRLLTLAPAFNNASASAGVAKRIPSGGVNPLGAEPST